MSSKMASPSLEKLPLAVNNSSLFTDYYLAELLKDDSFFRKSKGRAREAWEAIKAQYEKEKGLLPAANEAETERRFIRPVLDILGHKDLYSLQPPVPSPEGIRRPDFAFFASREDLEAAEKNLREKPEYFAKALAVGDAKHWERSLDNKIKGPGDPFTNQNPSYQIDFYLRVTDKKWGILTNGRHWRLYNRDTSYRMDVCYEIDLPAMLEKYDDSFVYFYAFFCKEAFTSGFLDRAYKASQEYVAKLGDELKENVYEALRLLAEGFLKFPDNGLSEGDLERIRTNTFVLIYRLLFLFYAEDRRLLPLENQNYRSYSLRELAKEIGERLDRGHAFSPAARGYWAKLQDLFRIVNEGDALLSVPPYNGGLFDESKHPFLKSYKVGDLYLAQAIDQLARAEASGRTGRGPVNYRDLEVRHIGAIYEGLLEHHLRVADQEIAVVKEKGREKFIPITELNGRKPLKTYQAGEVYLETDKGERKATGSYYTPHYIVQYIVNNTLGPLIEEKRKEIEQTKQELEEKVKHSRGYNREVYKKQLREIGTRLIDEILSIKVLDPAMGSGHFLVEATNFLAKELIRALGESPEEVEEEEIRWARREVVERCIFGVDLNPLAVELAKLSLWLYTVAKDRPLSFLDHHLRLGNSLIGAWVKDLGAPPILKKRRRKVAEGRLGLFEGALKRRLPIVIGRVLEVLRMPSDKVEQVRQKEAIYGKVLEILHPFKEVANVWTSVYFGNEVKNYYPLLQKLEAPSAEWESEVRSQPWFAKAQAIAEDKHFFHWELEFPEVFYQETGQRKEKPGFDAVIGNPPYVMELRDNKELFRELQTSPLGQKYYETKMDIFYFFIEHGIDLLKQNARLGFIVQEYWVSRAHASKLRKKIFEDTAPKILVDFKGFQVFKDATGQHNMIVILERSKGKDKTVILSLKNSDMREEDVIKALALEPEKQDTFEERKREASELYDTTTDKVYLSESEISDLQIKLEERSFNLKGEEIQIGADVHQPFLRAGVLSKLPDPTNHQPGEGIFVLSRDEFKKFKWTNDEQEILKSFHYAEELEKFSYASDTEHYLIYTPKKVARDIEENPSKYPNIKAHLDAYQQVITSDNKPYGIHRARQPEWFEDSQKIIGVRKTKYPKFAVVPDPYYMDQSVFIIRLTVHKEYSPHFVCAVLNSKVAHSWFFQQKRQGEQLQIDKEVLLHFPIRRIAFTTPQEERARLVKKGKKVYLEALERLGLGGEE